MSYGLRVCATILIASLSGWGMSLTGMPLGWLLGAMLIIFVASLLRLPVEQPGPALPFVRAIIGTLLGAQFTLELVQSFSEWWFSLGLLLIALISMGGIGFWLLRRLFGLDQPTALLCAIPGGIAEMILLSDQAGADQVRVAIMHALRIALAIIILPLLITWFAGIEVNRASDLPNSHIALMDWFWIAFCVSAGLLVRNIKKLPMGIVLVPLVISAGLHIGNVTQFVLPSSIMVTVQIFIGIHVGARFIGVSAAALFNVFAAAGTVVAVQITCGFSMAWMVGQVTDLDKLALALAYSPGGFAEMSLIAIAMGREVAFVGVHHIFRVLVALFTGPVLLRLFVSNRGKT